MKDVAMEKYLARDLKEALKLYMQILMLYQNQLPFEEAALATCHYSLSMTYRYLKKYQNACVHGTEALKIRKKLFGPFNKKTRKAELQVMECMKLLSPASSGNQEVVNL